MQDGLSELLNRFRQNGHDEADSWVGTGENREIDDRNLEHAIGPDVLDTLSQQTGLSREELLATAVAHFAQGGGRLYAERPGGSRVAASARDHLRAADRAQAFPGPDVAIEVKRASARRASASASASASWRT